MMKMDSWTSHQSYLLLMVEQKVRMIAVSCLVWCYQVALRVAYSV